MLLISGNNIILIYLFVSYLKNYNIILFWIIRNIRMFNLELSEIVDIQMFNDYFLLVIFQKNKI